MRIAGLGHALPKVRADNDDVVSLYKQRFGTGDSCIWPEVEAEIRRTLEISGAETRHLCSDAETAFDLGLIASKNALQDAGLQPGDIDLIIYASVSRGWLEPAKAHGFQHALGATGASCFDVIDACASWLRAMELAAALTASNNYRHALIVSVEAAMHHHMRLDFSRTSNRAEYLPAATLGEAAGACVVEPGDQFYSTMKSFGDGLALCNLPLPNWRKFVPTELANLPETEHFKASSSALVRRVANHMVDIFRADKQLREPTYDVTFAHTVSTRAAKFVGNSIGWPTQHFINTFPEYGNTAAATLPLGMSIARERNQLNRGDRCLLAVGSAGITVGFASFEF